MKYLRVTVIAWLALGASVFAQAPAAQPKAAPQKSPADLAAEEFFKLRDDKAAKPDDERFKKLIAAGIAFIEQHPTHGRVNAVVNGLANFADTMSDKSLAAYRSNFRGLLKFAIIDERDKDGLKPEARAAVAALEAAAQDAETREVFTKDNLDTLREKIDRLASMPGGGRFMQDRERSFVEILNRSGNAPLAERHLRKLTQSADKGLAAWAQSDLNLVEIKKAPYALKFTGIDGKEVDFAKLRGKAVALVFFATTNEGSVKNLVALKDVQSLYKRELAVVAVSFDKEENRAKLDETLKAQKLAFPVYFDGKEAKNDWAPKLNISSVPRIAFFDQKGILLNNNLAANRVEAEVKRLFKIQ
jgi:peroxiredoxin/plasmid stabilization system protein ParE